MQSKVQNRKSKLVAGRHSGRLVRHYFFISALLIGGGLVTSGFVEVYFRYHENRYHLARLQQEIANGTAFKIEEFVQGIKLLMVASTRNRAIANKGLSQEYKFELKRLLSTVPAITEATAVDLKGVVHARTSRLPVSLFIEEHRPSVTVALQQAKESKSYFSQTYFLHGSEPYMTIAVPIQRFPGDIIGALLAEVNLRYVGDVVSGIKVGNAGVAYVVTRSGDLIAHKDVSLVLQHRNLAHLDPVKTAFDLISSQNRQEVMVSNNLTGEKVLSSYAFIRSLNWVVIVERPENEVYELLYASILRTSSLLIIGFGMALLASILLARRVIRPLHTLREGAEENKGLRTLLIRKP